MYLFIVDDYILLIKFVFYELHYNTSRQDI